MKIANCSPCMWLDVHSELIINYLLTFTFALSIKLKMKYNHHLGTAFIQINPESLRKWSALYLYPTMEFLNILNCGKSIFLENRRTTPYYKFTHARACPVHLVAWIAGFSTKLRYSTRCFWFQIYKSKAQNFNSFLLILDI